MMGNSLPRTIRFAASCRSCGFQDGDLPPALSLVAVEPVNVRLAALKQTEEGDGLLLRLVEVDMMERLEQEVKPCALAL